LIKKEGWEIRTPAYDVATWIEHGAPIRRKDDAYLIAAAPALLEALRPFAFLAEAINRRSWKDDHPVWSFDGVELTVGDFRRAFLVVAQVEENEEDQ
jgi:hypothetical protein